MKKVEAAKLIHYDVIASEQERKQMERHPLIVDTQITRLKGTMDAACEELKKCSLYNEKHLNLISQKCTTWLGAYIDLGRLSPSRAKKYETTLPIIQSIKKQALTSLSRLQKLERDFYFSIMRRAVQKRDSSGTFSTREFQKIMGELKPIFRDDPIKNRCIQLTDRGFFSIEQTLVERIASSIIRSHWSCCCLRVKTRSYELISLEAPLLTSKEVVQWLDGVNKKEIISDIPERFPQKPAGRYSKSGDLP